MPSCFSLTLFSLLERTCLGSQSKFIVTIDNFCQDRSFDWCVVLGFRAPPILLLATTGSGYLLSSPELRELSSRAEAWGAFSDASSTFWMSFPHDSFKVREGCSELAWGTDKCFSNPLWHSVQVLVNFLFLPLAWEKGMALFSSPLFSSLLF